MKSDKWSRRPDSPGTAEILDENYHAQFVERKWSFAEWTNYKQMFDKAKYIWKRVSTSRYKRGLSPPALPRGISIKQVKTFFFPPPQ